MKYPGLRSGVYCESWLKTLLRVRGFFTRLLNLLKKSPRLYKVSLTNFKKMKVPKKGYKMLPSLKGQP